MIYVKTSREGIFSDSLSFTSSYHFQWPWLHISGSQLCQRVFTEKFMSFYNSVKTLIGKYVY